MAARENFKKQLNKLGRSAQTASYEGLSGPTLVRAMEVGIHFLLAAIFAGGMILDDRSPFGVAIVAGAGSGLCGGAALLGVALGSLTLLGFSNGLRYLSAAILTFSVAFAFHDVPLLRRPWVMPVVAGIINGCTGFIYFSRRGWTAEQIIFFAGEILFTILTAWACRMVLFPVRSGTGERAALSPQRRWAMVLLSCVTLVSLSPLHFLKDLSLGRVLAVILVLAVSWRGGCASGAVMGILAGLFMDLSSGGSPIYSMAYGVSAVAAGLFRGHSRLSAAIFYILGNAAAVLWTWELGLPMSILYEVFLGTVLFMILPQKSLNRLGMLLAPSVSQSKDISGTERVRRKMESTCAALRSLCDSLRSSISPPQNDNDVAAVFDRAAIKVCKHCSLRAQCWERDYVTTFNALNDATPAMMDRGRSEAADFPHHFADHCLHFPAFIEAVNAELTALFYRRQYTSRIRESRTAVLQQYTQLSSLLGDMAAELSQELTPAPTEEQQLRLYLSSQSLEADVSAFRDHRGLLRAELRGNGVRELSRTRTVEEYSRLLNLPLRIQQEEDVTLLFQQEPLMALAGVAARKKDGELVCGDAGTYFKRDDGLLYLLLCDGMGSGPQAHQESSLAVRMLEQFLLAGVSAEQALATLNSALGLRGEETGGFTTVDLLQVDLFTGDAAVHKLGAAPTYVKKGQSVRRITGVSLPAGLGVTEPSRPDKMNFHLEPGDCVLMVSDGVTGTEDDGWLQKRLAAFDGKSPKDLACNLITDSPDGATDDRTAMVIRIARRGQERDGGETQKAKK